LKFIVSSKNTIGPAWLHRPHCCTSGGLRDCDLLSVRGREGSPLGTKRSHIAETHSDFADLGVTALAKGNLIVHKDRHRRNERHGRQDEEPRLKQEAWGAGTPLGTSLDTGSDQGVYLALRLDGSLFGALLHTPGVNGLKPRASGAALEMTRYRPCSQGTAPGSLWNRVGGAVRHLYGIWPRPYLTVPSLRSSPERQAQACHRTGHDCRHEALQRDRTRCTLDLE
jgi:hypothetical protein